MSIKGLSLRKVDGTDLDGLVNQKSSEKEDLELKSIQGNVDEKRSAFMLSKLSKMTVKLRNLKPRVEDERDGLVCIEQPVLSQESDQESLSKEVKKRSLFDLPKRLIDFSYTKADQHPDFRLRCDSAEPDKDSSWFSLHLAAKEGAIERVKDIIEKYKMLHTMSSKKFINERDKLNGNGFSALHLAARYNQKNVVEYLLDNNALLNGPDRDDSNTPLLLAAKYGMTATASFLITKGADVMLKNKYGTTALHYASRRGNKALVLKILEVPNVDINVQDGNLATPLHLAMNGGCKQVVSVLIQYGANVFATDNVGEMPIHYAAASIVDNLKIELSKGDYFVLKESNNKKNPFPFISSSIVEDLIELLLKGALNNVSRDEYDTRKNEFVNSRTNEKDTPLHIAARCGNEKSLNILMRIGADVNAQTDTGSTPLHLAAISGQKEVVKALVLSNAYVNAVDNDLMTPLHRACQFGRLSAIKLLDKNDALLDTKDKNNFTPFLCAVWKGHMEVISYLIGRGVKINSTDINNKNALHIAIEENQLEVVKFLLEHGGSSLINGVDKDYRAPVHYAAANGNVQALELLIKKNAPIDIGENQERTPLHLAAEHGHLACVKLLSSLSSGEISSTDAHAMSPLHLAASNDHRKVVKLLIEVGADVCLRDNLSWSPLDYAAKNGHQKSMQILLENGAPIDACDKNNYSPLHHAASAGCIECITGLLDYGANIVLQTKEKKNCLDLAVENSEKEACMAIVKHKRWREALHNIDSNGIHVMEKLIELAPEVAEIALNNCITYSDIDKKHEDYTIEYNFEFVDIDPDKREKGDCFFAPTLMVRFQREKLLSHPLVVKLINQKWSRMGRWIYLCSLMLYLGFVSLLTALVIIEKMNYKDKPKIKCSSVKFTDIITWLTLGVACTQIFSKFILALYIGRNYILNPVKVLELLLYFSTALFMVPFIACQVKSNVTGLEEMKWQAGAISVLFAWSKLLLYLENLPFLGLYVVMFTEVLYTLLQVLIVFSILLIGFALSFYALLDLQAPFSDFGRAVVKTLVMMLGELSYDSIFTDNYSKENRYLIPNAEMSTFIFLLFGIIMIIVVMNLLVGLAVGDIESVRKNAYLRILQKQVYLLSILDRTYPKFILRYVYKKYHIEKPNLKSFNKRLMRWLGKYNSKVLQEEQFEVRGREDLIMREIESNKESILKQKLKTKIILDALEKQLAKTKIIAKCISNSTCKNNED